MGAAETILEIDIPKYQKWNPAENKKGEDIDGDWHKMANKWFADDDIKERTMAEKMAWSICCGLKSRDRKKPIVITLSKFAKYMGRRVRPCVVMESLEKLAVDGMLKIKSEAKVAQQSRQQSRNSHGKSRATVTATVAQQSSCNPLESGDKISIIDIELEEEKDIELELRKSGNPQADRQQPDSTKPIDQPPADSGKKYQFLDSDLRLAKALHAHVKKNPLAERFHQVNLEAWANDFRLLREHGPPERRIFEVVDWATRTPPWDKAIQSPSGLRRYWDTIEEQFNKANDGSGYLEARA